MPASALYHVILDGQGYLIDEQSYRRSVAPAFGPKQRQGDALYGDLAFGGAWLQDSWVPGFGYLERDPAFPNRWADGNAIDTSYGDIRAGRSFSVAGSNIATYAMAAYQGTLYAIAESSGHVYSSTTGASWSDTKDLNTVSAVTSLRTITVYNGLLIIGAGDSGKLFSFDGTTWSLWTTITNATA